MTPALTFLFIALALIATELLIMQFSVFWFLFFGVGALVTSLLCWLFPGFGWTIAWGLFLVSSLLSAALLYPPLKRWQAQPSPLAGNDAIGQTAEVIEPISASSQGKVTWSGSDWPAQLAQGEAEFSKGETAVIRKIEGIRLIVGR